MTNARNCGLSLNDVVTKLDNFAPKSLAETWDNVGLLVEPVTKRNIERILLTNDLTEDVMEEAVKVRADLIISYHPPIFVPLKSVTGRTWKVRSESEELNHTCIPYLNTFTRACLTVVQVR
jgi:putative NIF3 family GTP cyclohydrolase 1 type 2